MVPEGTPRAISGPENPFKLMNITPKSFLHGHKWLLYIFPNTNNISTTEYFNVLHRKLAISPKELLPPHQQFTHTSLHPNKNTSNRQTRANVLSLLFSAVWTMRQHVGSFSSFFLFLSFSPSFFLFKGKKEHQAKNNDGATTRTKAVPTTGTINDCIYRKMSFSHARPSYTIALQAVLLPCFEQLYSLKRTITGS